ncbi:uncharacterized protein LOC119995934 [Tripterygium wilfordii]|uniref:uncharacterized protein LOC119995934 n=1 Tax=Tripterygium wilfordii TaxID=458696 RepID=UPI0018F828DA|nr:uncharacterized protein LOC119995934 [Tripterygium wilfordii]XP_038698342.1 uncharacterized protein LOC119995934 [Tripterygium wilfordii]XP_038698343.1 uncharacterized protein LOC119995934 [Tripterygium wilfordii]
MFSSLIVLSVAHLSADTWQRISCIGLQDRISSHQLLDLVCCFPLQQLGRLALCIWTFLCLPPPDSFYSYSYSSDDSDSDDSDNDRDHRHHQQQSHQQRDSSSSSTVDLDAYYYEANSHSD